MISKRNLIMALLAGGFFSTCWAQLPKAAEFLPLKVGNIWQYQRYDGFGVPYQWEVIADSLLGDSLLVCQILGTDLAEPRAPEGFGYFNYNLDSSIVYRHSAFPENPYLGFPMIDTRNGLDGRWTWLFGDFLGTLAITDTGSVSFFGQMRKWAEVNTIIEEGDTFRI